MWPRRSSRGSPESVPIWGSDWPHIPHSGRDTESGRSPGRVGARPCRPPNATGSTQSRCPVLFRVRRLWRSPAVSARRRIDRPPARGTLRQSMTMVRAGTMATDLAEGNDQDGSRATPRRVGGSRSDDRDTRPARAVRLERDDRARRSWHQLRCAAGRGRRAGRRIRLREVGVVAGRHAASRRQQQHAFLGLGQPARQELLPAAGGSDATCPGAARSR